MRDPFFVPREGESHLSPALPHPRAGVGASSGQRRLWDQSILGPPLVPCVFNPHGVPTAVTPFKLFIPAAARSARRTAAATGFALLLLSVASLKGDFGLTAQGHHLSTLDTVPALGFLNTTIRAGGGPRARGLLRMMSTMLSMPRSHPSRSHPRGLWRRGRMKRRRLQRTTVNLFRYLIGTVGFFLASVAQ